MKRISIYEYEGTDTNNIHLYDLSSDEVELFSIEGLTYTEATKTIDDLINQYNLQPSDRITNYVFDHEKYLKEIIKSTIQEYQITL